MSTTVHPRPNALNLPDRPPSSSSALAAKKVIKAQITKRRSKVVPLSERVNLERVLGLTVKDNRTFACDPGTGLIVYPAGCVIVLYNPRRNKQSHIINHSRKTITALAISDDGKNIVSGECGHKPAVRVWDVDEKTQLAEFYGHKFGITCVAFSPNLKYVVSVGEQHDMVVNVWDWKGDTKHAAGKISAKVSGIAFSEDGSRFVTAGNRSIRFWYMTSKGKTRETIPLNSRAGILGEQRNNFFVSVSCGRGVNQSKTYAVTKSGLLCEFDEQRLLDKWVELRTVCAYSIVAVEEYLFVGCADGIVRLFDASTLNFVATLPRPHFLGVNVSDGIDSSHMITHRDNAKYPGAIAIVYDDISKKIACIYNDHSMYVWDVHDVKKIGKQRSFLYHSSCIWGAEVYPSLDNEAANKEALPLGSFLTYGSDDTIRMWNVDPAMNTDTFKRNIYSNELLKVIYVDEQLENLCNDSSPTNDKNTTDNEAKNGIRCVSISSDGQFLASGDRSGNVRIHDMQFMDKVHDIEAHDSEVLCLEFSQPESGYYLLASASRDRLIHVLNMQDDCSLVQTIDDHSASITSVKFTQSSGRLQLISCSADKALMFRVAMQNPDFALTRNHHVVGKTTIYDLAVDPTEKYVATACQDRNIRIYNTVTGKLKQTYKGTSGDDGTLIRVEMDPSGMYIATSCSDKTVAIFDFYSGECVATMAGHSELVTGIKFTNDCKHLISTSGDGCIFVWRLPWGFTHNMKERLKEMGQQLKPTPQDDLIDRRGTYVIPPELNFDSAMLMSTEARINMKNRPMPAVNPVTKCDSADMGKTDESQDGSDDSEEPEEVQEQRDGQTRPKLHVSAELPLWAKKQVCGEDLPSPTTYSNPAQPKGRWAQRLDSKGFKVKSEWDAHRDIELKLQDGFDRRRYTVEPDALADQAALVAAERQQRSLSLTEENEFLPADEALAGLEEGVNMPNHVLEEYMNSSRGSDPFLPPTNLPTGILCPETPEDEDGELDKPSDAGEEEEDDEANEIIIYPPSEESTTCPENLKFEVTESTLTLEECQRRRARSYIKHDQKSKISPRNSRVLQDTEAITESEVEGSEAIDQVTLENSDDDNDIDDDEEEEEEEEEEDPDDDEITEKMIEDESSSSTTITATNTTNATPSETSTPSPLHQLSISQDSTSPDQEDERSFLNTNYCFQEKEKFGKCLEQLQSGFSASMDSPGLATPSGDTPGFVSGPHRLSISAKFLSRSQLSQINFIRSVAGSVQSNLSSSSVGGVTAQVMGWNSVTLGTKSTTSSASTTAATTTATTTPTTTPVPTPTALNDSTKTTPTVPSEKKDEHNPKNEPPTANITVSTTLHPVKAPADQYASKEIAASKDSEKLEEKQEDHVLKTRSESQETKAAKEAWTENKTPPMGIEPDELTEVDIIVQAQPAEVAPVTSCDHQLNGFDHSHTPIIIGKRSVISSEETVAKANKENIERSSEYDPHHGRRSISSGSKNKMEKMKARKDPTLMKKSTSMSDLSEANNSNIDNNTESASMNMVLRSHPRSHSVERRPPKTQTQVKEKPRISCDRFLPLVPATTTLRPKSYEVGTTSSLAKMSSRKDSETPPTSPSRLIKRKRPSLADDGTGRPLSRSADNSPTGKELMVGVAVDIEMQSAKDSLAEKARQILEATVESKERGMREAKLLADNKPPTKSDQNASDLQDDLRNASDATRPTDLQKKDKADKLAMPPPQTVTVAKRSSGGRPGRSTASKSVEEVKQRRRQPRSSSTTPPLVGGDLPKERRRSSNSTSETSPPDTSSSVSTRNRAASYRETRRNSLSDSLSPKSSRKSLIQGNKKDNPQTGAGSLKPRNPPNQSPEDKSAARRRRREKIRANETNVSNNNSTSITRTSESTHTSPTCSAQIKGSEELHVASQRGWMAKTSDTGNVEKEKSPRRLDRTPVTKVSATGESTNMTFDFLKTRVDSMKAAFDQCLELCNKIQEGESCQRYLDYFSTTFSHMQQASSPILASSASGPSSKQHHLHYSATDDTLCDASVRLDDDLPQSPLANRLPRPINIISQSDVNILRASLTSCRKPSPPNGMASDVETTSAVALLDHYSDVLVSLVKRKMSEEISESSNTTTKTRRSMDTALE